MKRLIPWLRSVVAFPLGLGAIQLFHMASGQLLPETSGALESDSKRLLAITLATIAGIVGSFVVAIVARHRLWLHMALFLVIMGAIDLSAVLGALAPQPMWFKALIMGTLPLQVWLGGHLGRVGFRGDAPAAI